MFPACPAIVETRWRQALSSRGAALPKTVSRCRSGSGLMPGRTAARSSATVCSSSASEPWRPDTSEHREARAKRPHKVTAQTTAKHCIGGTSQNHRRIGRPRIMSTKTRQETPDRDDAHKCGRRATITQSRTPPYTAADQCAPRTETGCKHDCTYWHTPASKLPGQTQCDHGKHKHGQS